MKTNRELATRFDYSASFRAQEPLLGYEVQQRLKEVKLFVVGCGGLGFNIALAAARSGIETIIQCDPQSVEDDNLNRILAGTRHLGRPKLRVVEELLCSFDRATADPGFSYTPLQLPVEHPEVEEYLDRATHIISCPNSLAARRFVLRYAVKAGKTLLNVGVSCMGRALMGEVSAYWPDQPGFACPGCISLRGEEQAQETPLFYPPLLVLSGLSLQLLTAGLAGREESRPNYVAFEASRYSVAALTVGADPSCPFCASP